MRDGVASNGLARSCEAVFCRMPAYLREITTMKNFIFRRYKAMRRFSVNMMWALTLGGILLASHTAHAQDRFSIEIDGGVSFATQDLGDAGLGTGMGFEATLAYRIMPHLAGYAGWGWNHFPTDEPFAGAGLDVEETGYVFGLRFAHPFGTAPLGYYVQAGGLYNHLEFEDGDEIVADTGHGLGWEAGAGVMLSLGNDWRLLPGLLYRSLSRDVDMDGVNIDTELTYVSVRMGISKSF